MISLYVDMDGTLCEFRKGLPLSKLYEEGYFLNLNPFENVIEGLRLINEEKEINLHILSCYLTDRKHARKEKLEWLKRYTPFIENENIHFLPCGERKDLLCKKNEISFLLDDHSPNLTAFVGQNRYGIKLINNINGAGLNWKGDVIDYSLSPEEFAQRIKEIIYRKGDFVK